MSKCEKGIDCLQCNGRAMCLSYANFKYEQGYNKAIDDFEKEAMKQFTDFDLKHGYPTVTDCKIILRDIAEQLKSKTEF